MYQGQAHKNLPTVLDLVDLFLTFRFDLHQHIYLNMSTRDINTLLILEAMLLDLPF